MNSSSFIRVTMYSLIRLTRQICLLTFLQVILARRKAVSHCVGSREYLHKIFFRARVLKRDLEHVNITKLPGPSDKFHVRFFLEIVLFEWEQLSLGLPQVLVLCTSLFHKWHSASYFQLYKRQLINYTLGTLIGWILMLVRRNVVFSNASSFVCISGRPTVLSSLHNCKRNNEVPCIFI